MIGITCPVQFVFICILDSSLICSAPGEKRTHALQSTNVCRGLVKCRLSQDDLADSGRRTPRRNAWPDGSWDMIRSRPCPTAYSFSSRPPPTRLADPHQHLHSPIPDGPGRTIPHSQGVPGSRVGGRVATAVVWI